MKVNGCFVFPLRFLSDSLKTLLHLQQVLVTLGTNTERKKAGEEEEGKGVGEEEEEEDKEEEEEEGK